MPTERIMYGNTTVTIEIECFDCAGLTSDSIELKPGIDIDVAAAVDKGRAT